MGIPVVSAVTFVVLVMFLVTGAPGGVYGITCSDVIKDIQPCVTYLRSGSGLPPTPCCAGASNLASATTTTADKQTACTCLINASKNINLKPDLAKALPRNCGISLSFEVSPNTDCTKIT